MPDKVASVTKGRLTSAAFDAIVKSIADRPALISWPKAPTAFTPLVESSVMGELAKSVARQRVDLSQGLLPDVEAMSKRNAQIERVVAKMRPLMEATSYASLLVGSAPAPRYTATPSRKPESGDRVDVFLRRAHPSLVAKRAGMQASPDRPDGISQSANSGAELLRILISRLVPVESVWAYMAEAGLGVKPRGRHARPPKEYHFDLISHRYGLDSATVSHLSLRGSLGNRLEDLKHDHWTMDAGQARAELVTCAKQVEDLLAYLASSIR